MERAGSGSWNDGDDAVFEDLMGDAGRLRTDDVFSQRFWGGGGRGKWGVYCMGRDEESWGVTGDQGPRAVEAVATLPFPTFPVRFAFVKVVTLTGSLTNPLRPRN